MATYTAKDITVLEGLEPVRKRPGMYIGGVGSAGLHHLVWEILDNSIDEAMNGYASNITVTLHEDGSSITIVRRRARHSGRQASEDEEERARGDLLDAARRRQVRAGNYKTAGGLHGVGASVVNALSKELVATVRRDGAQWEMKFKQGQMVGALTKSGRGPRHRDDGVLPPRLDDLPEGRVRPRADPPAARGLELPAQGREDRVRGRGAARSASSSSTPRGSPTT